MFRNRWFIFRQTVVQTTYRYGIEWCICISISTYKAAYTDACKTHSTISVRTTVFLKTNPRFRNIWKTQIKILVYKRFILLVYTVKLYYNARCKIRLRKGNFTELKSSSFLSLKISVVTISRIFIKVYFVEQSVRWSWIWLPCLKPESSLTFTQNPSSRPSPELDESM